MDARLLHVSDLHVGTHEELEVEQALKRLVERLEPQLVVASGDLAHRGRPQELQRAAELLRSLGPPVLAVPGNHDLPYTPSRFAGPW
ncbi:MAG TPA: metallophosphoesterase, partial [Gaiellaceae bacterium]